MRSRRLLRTVASLVPVSVAAIGLAPVAQAQAAGGPATPAPLSAAEAQSLSTNVTQKVIIVLKDQLSSTPGDVNHPAARVNAAHASQAPLLGELAQTHAQNTQSLQFLNAVTATVSPGEAERLAADPTVARVVTDRPIPIRSSGNDLAPAAPTGAAGVTPLPGACAPNGQVQLNPQAVEDIHAATQDGQGPSAQALGYSGAGVKVGFIADGVDTNNPDFIRPDGTHVFTDYQDFSGTGTNAPTGGGEAFLDASSVAAQGRQTYNVAGYGVGLNQPCNIRVLGVAPGASLVGLNVFGSSNIAYNSVFLEAINYAVNVDHVNVLNESFGSNPFPDSATLDLTRMADDAAVAAGVTVTASSGDAGVTNTIGSPATDPNVISAAASTTYRSYAQVGTGHITLPGITGWLDDNVSGLSSSGFDQTGRTVDIIAPGDLNWAVCTPDPARFASCTDQHGNPSPVEQSGGTSESAPLTAGVAALVDQAYGQTHGGAMPSPAVVKQIITSTATDIAAPADLQGAGLLNAYQAVLAAASFAGSSAGPTGRSVLTSANQLNAVGQPHATQKLTETLTNDGKSSETVGLTSRTLGAYTTVGTSTVNLADSTGNAALVHFSVPSGQARLNGSITFKSASATSANRSARVGLSLISPSGKLASYSLPQGAGNYGNAEVANPEPGTWTALIFGSPSTLGGTTGPVTFGASAAGWDPFGVLSTPSVTLNPGASGTFSLTVPTPANPGDEAGSIVLSNPAATPAFTQTTTVPVTLRSLAPTPAPSTSFSGTLTGGNGRQTSTGQSAYYQVSIPAGTKALNAQISTPSAANTFDAELIDPTTGEAASTASNNLLAGNANGQPVLNPQRGTRLHVLAPAPGRWTLAVNFYNQVSGTALSQPINVSLDSTLAPVSATGLPNSAATRVPAGKPVTVGVKVTNNGSTPEAYFTDSRLHTASTLNLAAQTSAAITVPITASTVPQYLVPTHTTSITATASAPAPIFFDYFWNYGDPDLASSSTPFSTTATGTFTSSAVVQGEWGISPFQDGPTGPTPAKPVTAQTAMTATSAAFDPTVSSPTGDLWLASVNAGSGFTPYVVGPGQSVTIPVTITPTGASGTTVTGTLYVDDSSPLAGLSGVNGFAGVFPEGSDLGALPYSYTIR